MQIVRNIAELSTINNVCLTIGTFDGIHCGHDRIIHAVIKKAREIKAKSILVTFNHHPQNVIHQGKNRIRLLTSEREKLALLNRYHLDLVAFINFNKQLAGLSAEEFLKHTILPVFQIGWLMIGHNHAIGRHREGNPKKLIELANRLKFNIGLVDPVNIDGEVVSSTLIRRLISEGQVVRAQQFLGRNYSISGVVQTGKQLGSRFGFPTANLRLLDRDKLIPGDGGYAVWVKINKQKFSGMANIGFSPTVQGRKRNIEIHIHDFSGNLYDQILEVEFVDRIRSEKTFQSVKDLINQLKKDKKRSKKILMNN